MPPILCITAGSEHWHLFEVGAAHPEIVDPVHRLISFALGHTRMILPDLYPVGLVGLQVI